MPGAVLNMAATPLKWAGVRIVLKFLVPLALAAIVLGAPPVQAASAAVLSDADRAAVARVERYLNDIQSLRARFLQVAPDGSLSQGRFFMKRPGRLRFEYDPPTPLLVITDGIWVIFYDHEIDQVSRVPLSSTPLEVLVRERRERRHCQLRHPDDE